MGGRGRLADRSPGASRIASSVLVAAAPAQVFEYLRALDNHWELTGGRVARLESGERSALVRIRGPFGIERTARTQVVETTAPSLMVGRAQLRSGTSGTVRWSLEPAPGGTRVELSATVESARPRDRLLLALGGRAWFRRCFAEALERLARRFG